MISSLRLLKIDKNIFERKLKLNQTIKPMYLIFAVGRNTPFLRELVGIELELNKAILLARECQTDSQISFNKESIRIYAPQVGKRYQELADFRNSADGNTPTINMPYIARRVYEKGDPEWEEKTYTFITQIQN